MGCLSSRQTTTTSRTGADTDMSTTLPPATYDGESTTRKPHPNPATVSAPTFAQFDAAHTQLAAGVAIFHLASRRCVVCYHQRDGYHFLPKGRKDAGEALERAACREGFEESGYRCRLLPLPQRHRQPQPAETWGLGADGAGGKGGKNTQASFTTEPLWTQLAPNRRATQYILFWYAAETLSPDDEAVADRETAVLSERGGLTTGGVAPYAAPVPYPAGLMLAQRRAQDGEGYEPPRHENTGVDEEEACYTSMLLPIEEAVDKLTATSGVMADVVLRAWEGIQARDAIELEVQQSWRP